MHANEGMHAIEGVHAIEGTHVSNDDAALRKAVLNIAGHCWALVGSAGSCWAVLGRAGQCWAGRVGFACVAIESRRVVIVSFEDRPPTARNRRCRSADLCG
jgi:hypothetical protein